MNIGFSNSAMNDIAHNRYLEALELLLEVAHGVHVQQTLSWMLMTTIPCIDNMDMRRYMFGNFNRRFRNIMTNNKNIRLHRY